MATVTKMLSNRMNINYTMNNARAVLHAAKRKQLQEVKTAYFMYINSPLSITEPFLTVFTDCSPSQLLNTSTPLSQETSQQKIT